MNCSYRLKTDDYVRDVYTDDVVIVEDFDTRQTIEMPIADAIKHFADNNDRTVIVNDALCDVLYQHEPAIQRRSR